MTSSVDLVKAKAVHLSHISQLTSTDEELPPSFLFPHSYWTTAQKTAFYKSLVRHTRWRPELIAADLDGEKSIAEICSYIELLEQASSRIRRRSSTSFAAREVTESWIILEEILCAELSQNENKWHTSSLKRKRNSRLKEIKRLEYGSKDSKEDQAIESESLTDGVDSLAWEERFRSRKKELRTKWKREDLLMSLDARHLRTLDTMVLAPENKEQEQELGPITLYGRPAHDVNPQPNDPARRTTSTSPRFIGIDTNQQNNSILPEKTVSSAVNESQLPDTYRDLSPVSRRRLRKRLWMRQKRAQKSGISLETVSRDITKLKRGRKPNANHASNANLEDTIIPDSTGVGASCRTGTAVSQQHPENKLSEETSHKRDPFGWSKLTSLGIDGRSLRADGIDLFHLEKLSNLTSLYRKAKSSQLTSENSDDDEESDCYLPYRLLQFVRACVVHFLTRVIAYTITHKEIDTRQKQRISSLCMPKEIKSETIYATLAILRQEGDSKAIFQRLKKALRQTMSSSPEVCGEESFEEESSEEEGSEEESSEDEKDGKEAFFGPGEPQTSTAYWDPTSLAHFCDKNILPSVLEEIDDNKLEKELQMDEIVNKNDQYADLLYEQGLWTEVEADGDAKPAKEIIELIRDRLPQPIPGELGIFTQEGSDIHNQSLKHRTLPGAAKAKTFVASDEDI